MILTFHMPPLARGQGVCDIDRVWFRDSELQSYSEKIQNIGEF